MRLGEVMWDEQVLAGFRVVFRENMITECVEVMVTGMGKETLRRLK